MRIFRPLSLILPFLSTVFADVEFVDPAPESTLKGGDVITTHWKESGKGPKISELSRFDIFLCAGGDTSGSYEELVAPIKNASFARGNSVSFKVDPDVGGNEANAYFLKMVSTGPDAVAINFSNRFSFTNMTGSFKPRIMNGINSIQAANGPTPTHDHGQNALYKRQNERAYTIPYELQTGLTRYAPMAKKPGSTIPPGKPTPQHPTSAYSIATTYLGSPTIETTKSAERTYSVSSIENTASPAPHPHDKNMKRWLERWKD